MIFASRTRGAEKTVTTVHFGAPDPHPHPDQIFDFRIELRSYVIHIFDTPHDMVKKIFLNFLKTVRTVRACAPWPNRKSHTCHVGCFLSGSYGQDEQI